ncbi:MAG: transporter transrane protein [Firmicutes bacterium]|nr:transporter transrane protein [Bacillota bacterium]
MNSMNEFPKFRWFVLATLCLVTATTAVVLISPASLIGAIAKGLRISPGEATGAAMGTFNFCVAISCLCGGMLLDRFGTVRVWIVCLIMIAVGEIGASSLGDSIFGFYILRLIQGLGTGPIMASTVRVAAQWFPPNERGIVAGVQGLAMGMGTCIGAVVSPMILAVSGDWGMTMGWLGVMPVIALVMTVVIGFGPEAPNEHLVQANRETQESRSDFALAIRMPATWGAIICVVLLSWVMQGFNDLIPGYIAIEPPVGLGRNPVVAGQFMMVLQIAFMAGAILSGFIVDRLFEGRSRPVVFLGFLGTAIFCFAVRFSFVHSSNFILLVDLALTGLCQSVCIPATIAFIARSYPGHITGRLGGLAQGIGVFGGTAGVTLGAYALDSSGYYNNSILAVVIIAFIGCGCALLQKPPEVFSRYRNWN